MSDPGADTQYRFLPSVRRGLRPDEAYPASVSAASTVAVTLNVEGRTPEGPSDTLPAETLVRLYGPGDVIGLDARQVVRTEPADGATDVEPNYFAHIEFDRPDLPWLFSPERAERDRGRARPWLSLVVIERQPGVELSADTGGPLPVLTIGGEAHPADELPPPGETWAWAHAQVVGADETLERGTVASELDDQSPRTLSRLISPRRLEASTAYLACVVPTFEVGRVAGLGEDLSTVAAGETLKTAWRTSDSAEDAEPVRLPVYYSWEFATGPRGDFESLVRALEPRELGDDVGSRPVDLSDPGIRDLDAPRLMDGALRLGGALRTVGFDPKRPAYPEPADEALIDELRRVIDRPATIRDATGEPVVGPPTYGRWHADLERLPDPTDEPPSRFRDSWLEELNLDPRHRLTAGFGTDVVQTNQESLMATAWDQYGDLTWANRLVRSVQVARAIGEVTVGALEGLSPGVLLSFTAPMHSRLRWRGAGDLTVRGRLGASQIPTAVVRPAFRRLTRPKGPLSRRVGVDLQLEPMLEGFDLGGSFFDRGPDLSTSTPSVSDRLVEGGSLDALGEYGSLFDIASGELGTAGWLESAGGDTIPDGGAARPDPGSTLIDEALGRLDSVEDHAVTARRRLSELAVALTGLEPVEESGSAGETVERIVFGAPSIEDRCSALAGSTFRPLSRSLARLLAATPDAAPGLSVDRKDELLGQLGDHHVELMAAVRGLPTPIGEEDTETSVTEVRRSIRRLDLILDVVEALRRALQLGSTTAAITAEGPPEGDIKPLSLTDTPGIGDLLDVEGPLVELVADRLELDTRWLVAARTDPLEEIMAAPSIDRPMYEPLRDRSVESFCPGVGNIPADTVGVLETNPPFVEAYMVGLSHEFARELLWRRYPTDRRGTYFRRFWDRRASVDAGAPADIKPIHHWLGADLGRNGPTVDAESPSQVVLIVRGKLLQRYPNTRIYAVKAIREPKDGGDDSTDRVPLFEATREAIRAGEVDVPPDYTREELLSDDWAPKEPVFRGTLTDDVTFFGFDLGTEAALGSETGSEEGWFFVLEEPPGEPRFGLDEADETDFGTVPAGIRADDGEPTRLSDAEYDAGTEVGWSALSWGHLVSSAAELSDTSHVEVDGLRPTGPSGSSWRVVEDDVWYDPSPDEAESGDEERFTAEQAAIWGQNSAHMARITWQLPVRVAVHADDMLPGGEFPDRATGGSA